jgi:DGQHR domain-containing protein
MPKQPVTLRLPAIEVTQGKEKLYSFAIDGKLIPEFAAISRIRRNDQRQIEGYQRPEALAHISEIRNYIESGAPTIPNAVVMALNSAVRFEPNAGKGDGPGYVRTGILIIPIDSSSDEADRPGFIVDGQQRLAAIRDAAVDSFPICVTAFITDDIRTQTEQFILVNSTKPLPKGLIYELLPNTEAVLPTQLHRRRLPALLLHRLNSDSGSPLQETIQTPTSPNGRIKDNSILKMLENSLNDGVLFRFRDGEGDGGDVEAMVTVLKDFWWAVRRAFADAWDLPPKRSRLTHGAGVVSLGFLMEAISERYRASGLPTEAQFAADLQLMKDVCRWTDGIWDFGPSNQRKWNAIQNTHADIQLLSQYLYYQYKARVWNNPASALSTAAR